MTFEQLVAEAIKFVLAGGAAGLVLAVADALNKRRAAMRDDRKQHTEESTAIAVNAKTIADAAGSVVKLQDDQADELRQQVVQLRAEKNAERDQSNRSLELLQARLTDAESRIARSERRAGESERQANESRTDVIRLGEQLDLERKSNATNINTLKRDHQNTINKLVLIIESMFKQLKQAGIEPDFELVDLKAMYIVEKAVA